jgi:hypothetical protein
MLPLIRAAVNFRGNRVVGQFEIGTELTTVTYRFNKKGPYEKWAFERKLEDSKMSKHRSHVNYFSFSLCGSSRKDVSWNTSTIV